MQWEVNVDGFRVGTQLFDDDKTTGYILSYKSPAIMSTVHSAITVPKELYHIIMDMIFQDLDHHVKDNRYVGPCDLSKYESLYLLMGNTYFEIPPSSFVLGFQAGTK